MSWRTVWTVCAGGRPSWTTRSTEAGSGTDPGKGMLPGGPAFDIGADGGIAGGKGALGTRGAKPEAEAVGRTLTGGERGGGSGRGKGVFGLDIRFS